MIKYKLGCQMYGYNYDVLAARYKGLSDLDIVSKEVIVNPNDEEDREEIMVISLTTIEEFQKIKEIIESALEDLPKDITYEGIMFANIYNNDDLKYEKYNDIEIMFD